MTKIKLCGLMRPCDIEAANALRPEYIGFVFAPDRRRYIPPEQAAELRKLLCPDIQAVGVFVREEPERVADLLNRGVIDLAQLHGGESADDIRRLRQLTDKELIQAFRVETEEDIRRAERSPADHILLDSGKGGTGRSFNWELLRETARPYFLAGGLTPENAGRAVRTLAPYGVDVSSGIETDGKKDKEKMRRFVCAVKGKEEKI